ncbi:MFS transporter [Priestia endophytica]|uniref:MFS transporter n=2 Tax=Priestia endophytica TaxID=135735 RepID=A0AAX1QAW1_9BACI|nr:MFS transporter [Priestia endophytica]RAS75998.1 MFS transporter [Priestia endophytica]RAS92203.1 MFS transporter [Priestia endophytica]
MKNNYRYFIIFMIVIITIINYIDRGALSYAQAEIIQEFNLDPISWGAILGYFGYGYIFGALFGGALADKKGPKFMWILAGTTWSIFEIGTIFAGHLGATFFGGSALAGFAVFRVLFGLAEGPTLSTMNRTMANWVSPNEKGFSVALGLVGTPIGALITAPVVVGLLTFTNWKVTFVILGLLGFIWVLVWRKVFTNLPEDHPKVSEIELRKIRSTNDLIEGEIKLEETLSKNVPWYYFFKNSTLTMNAIGYFAFLYVNILLLTWTPKYLQDEFNYSLASLSYIGMIPWVGAIITGLLGGKISDKLREKTGNLRIARSWFTVVCLFCTAVCFMLIPTAESATTVLSLMCIGNAFNYLPNSIYWTVILDTEPNKAGTFGGVTHFIANLATIIAPTLTGSLVASYGYNAMFIAAAFAVIVGMVSMIFVKPGQQGHMSVTPTTKDTTL